MSTNTKLDKELLSPPGDTIKETIDEIGMSQAELAKRLGRSRVKLNDIIKGREPITIKTAMKLERVLGIPVSFWRNREQEYREDLERINEKEFLENIKEWTQSFPLRDLKKMKWLPDTTDSSELADKLLKFFGVASPEEWETVYGQKYMQSAFKISNANTQTPHAISAWLRIGELKFNEKELSPFDKDAFKKRLNEIKYLVETQPTDFHIKLQDICAQCGVAIFYTKCLTKAPISGATWWYGGHPIIQLSGRYKHNDNFWFAFYHEAAHIIKHAKKDIFLEGLKGESREKEKEREADLFAQKSLFPLSALKRIKNEQSISDDIIKQYAREYNTHPAIITGQLQHYKIIKYSDKNYFKVKIHIV